MNFRKTKLSLLAALSLVALTAPAQAQTNTLIQTSLSAAITATAQTIPVASVTGMTASFTTVTELFIDRESMLVLGISGTTLTVARGQHGTPATPHASGEMVLSGRPDWFYTTNTRAMGGCTASTTYVTPYVDVSSGLEWLCSSVLSYWVPGWQNTTEPYAVTAAVASAAGAITPSGPLFHITGTSAITGFTIPVGFAYGSFCAIPDAVFTTTAAGNIALASTAVVNKQLCWTWDGTNSKFVPSY